MILITLVVIISGRRKGVCELLSECPSDRVTGWDKRVVCLASRLGLYLSRWEEAVTVVFMRDHSVRCSRYMGVCD